ncbi:MAG: family 16 glycoside hydrolase, partial [Chitinophagaceae bacterium]
ELAEPDGTGNLLGEMLRVSKGAVANDKAKAWKPNAWNSFRILMMGNAPRIKLWINGQLMWEVAEPVNDLIAGDTDGMIGLQVHWSAVYSAAAGAFDMSGSWRPGSLLRFRNIAIKVLNQDSK